MAIKGRRNGKSLQAAITLTPSEMDDINRRAEIKGLPTSTYLRYVVKRHLRLNPKEDA